MSGPGTERPPSAAPTEAARPQPIRSRRPGAGAPNDGAGPGPASLANLAWPGPPVALAAASLSGVDGVPPAQPEGVSPAGEANGAPSDPRLSLRGEPSNGSFALDLSGCRETQCAAAPVGKHN